MVGKRRFKSDLIPGSILIAHFFSAEQAELDELGVQLTTVEQELETQLEEHGADGGLLEDVVEGDADKPKITIKAVKAWLKENGDNDLLAEEAAAITAYGQLLDKQTSLKKKIKDRTETLHASMVERYAMLTEEEVKEFVVEDKWLGRVERDVQMEVTHVTRVLTERIVSLAERYSRPLSEGIAAVSRLESTVEAHLRSMGFSSR
jgi:type I restriction enzyme M protein